MQNDLATCERMVNHSMSLTVNKTRSKQQANFEEIKKTANRQPESIAYPSLNVINLSKCELNE